MKYFLVVGEASGDLHASNLMKGIMKADPEASFKFVGGDLMQGVYPGMIKHFRETSYMMLEAVLNIRKILGHIGEIKREMRTFDADVNILVDYPGVNLRLAKFAASAGMKVFYYITPTVWAWKKNRVHTLRRYTDRRFVIFPFEVDFLAENGVEAEFLGNPLMDAVERYRAAAPEGSRFREEAHLDPRPIVALLTGSRKQEIDALLPLMIPLADHYPDFQFVVAGSASVDVNHYRHLIGHHDIRLVYNRTYDLLSNAFAGIITSGTATLESALFNLPQVVIYKTNPLAYMIARRLVHVPFISQVNLIYGGELVKEVLQGAMLERVLEELKRLLYDPEYRKAICEGYAVVRGKLGSPGVSDRLGKRMVALLKS
ncbi:MAG: lipid-A-disaccharide synthase [Bacteroidales bacterium]|nr:lipid-A-disaccharide synthase [Bacteroidales bacterium]